MSGQVPPELRELLGLLAALSEMLPHPADHNWDRRREVENERHSLLASRLSMLDDQLATCALYPNVAGDLLSGFCQRSIKVIRAKLVEPLGYQVQADAAAGRPA
jgi:hypothetical protein